MSHELLLIAGTPDASAQGRRLATIAHAASLVPGSTSWSAIDSPTAIAALVETAPPGGTFAQLTRSVGGGRITVATTPAGITAAEATSAERGAEAGHVTVRLRPDQSVVVATDGVGFLPGYWSANDGVLLASTHLASLVSMGAPADIDELGLIEYLTMLHPMQDRTLLRAAKLLSPGMSLRWGEQQCDISRKPLFTPSLQPLSDYDVVATFASTWPQIIEDSMSGPGRTSLGLSGGLDSRAIAETAVGLGFRPLSYTYGAAPSREAIVGARVATVLQLPHLAIPVTDDRLLLNARDSLERLDGSHSASEMYELWFSDLLRRFTDVVVNGLAGGPLWGDDKAVGLTDPYAVEERQWKRYAAELRRITPFLSPDLQDGAEEAFRRALAESLDAWDVSARPDMIIFWKIANRQLRWGNMLTNALRRAGLRTEAPFLDSRFLSLAARLTADQRKNGNLYLRVHREVFPRTAVVSRSDDGNAPRSLDHVYWSGESTFLHQLGVLTAHHPLSGVRRGWRLGTSRALSQLRSRTSVNGPADRSDSRQSVFPADLWLRTRPTYAGRLVALLNVETDADVISSAATAAAAESITSGNPTVPALTLGKVAAVRAWLADYEHRATAFRGALTKPQSTDSPRS